MTKTTACNCGVGDKSKAAHGFSCPKRRLTKRDRLRRARARAVVALAALAALATSACSVEFETPQSWKDLAREELLERGLPAGIPEPGQRPDAFSCTVTTSLGALTVSGDSPDWTFFQVEGNQQFAVATPPDGYLSVDLSDGTDVIIVGDVLYLDGLWNRVDECAP